MGASESRAAMPLEPPPKRPRQAFRAVLVGSSCSGKSAFCNHLRGGPPTISSLFVSVESPIGPIQVWDTNGSEQCRSLLPLYLRDADAVLLMFDVGNRRHFAEMGDFLQMVKYGAKPDFVRIVVGTRFGRGEYEVGLEEVCKFAEACGAPYFEAWPGTGEGVQDVFDALVPELEKRFGSCAGVERAGCEFEGDTNDALELTEFGIEIA